jgi:hypothetical protein
MSNRWKQRGNVRFTRVDIQSAAAMGAKTHPGRSTAWRESRRRLPLRDPNHVTVPIA